MTLFINYRPAFGFSINTYRNAEGYANDDVLGLLDDVEGERPGSCPLDGSLAALQDGSILKGVNQSDAEWLHDFISEYDRIS